MALSQICVTSNGVESFIWTVARDQLLELSDGHRNQVKGFSRMRISGVPLKKPWAVDLLNTDDAGARPTVGAAYSSICIAAMPQSAC